MLFASRACTVLSWAVLSLTSGHAAPVPDGDAFAIRAEHVHLGDGTVIENGIVLVEGGKITEVGKGVPVPKQVVLLEREGHLSAGLIALRDHSGSAGEARDSTRAVMAGADLAHAFDAQHSDMQRLLAEGITTVVLAPTGGSLVGGSCAVVKPGKRVVARRTHLELEMGRSAISSNRYPTSYQGVQAELERLFTDPQGVFAEAAQGKLPVLLNAGTRSEARRAISFARRHGLKGVLCGVTRLADLAAEVKASGLGVAVNVHSPGSSRHVAEGALAMAKLEVPFGFTLGAPGRDPASLRFTAAACVRAGLDPALAERALTSTAAQLAGVGDRLGSVRTGMDADLVLWSGAPTDLASRVLAVYVDGEQVFEADYDDEDSDGGDE